MTPSAIINGIEQPWSRSAEEILEALEVSPEQGLDEKEAEARRKEVGRNRLRQIERKSAWLILLEQLKSPIVLLLAAAAAVSFAFGDLVEGIAIVAVIVLNSLIGFVLELRATRSMEALQELGSVDARALRAGQPQEIPAAELAPGDIVLVEGGDVVTADLRLFEASKLQATEAALTGESAPVSKSVEAIAADTALAGRRNMLFKGTSVTRGSGKGVVIATGMETEIGHISSLVEEAEEETTPLEKRLGQLGQRLIWVTLGVAALVAISGFLAGRDLKLMIETAVALAVASIPEGLPIVATVALARGMWRMARRNALVNRLSAVETLGATDVLLTDKTGTLTENQMTVRRLLLPGDEDGLVEIEVGGGGISTEGDFRRDGESIDAAGNPLLLQALQVSVLCNNASLHRDGDESGGEDGSLSTVGDPLEVALLVAGAKAGLQRPELLERLPEEREEAFDPDAMRMATIHRHEGAYRVAVKGALGAVLEVSTHIAAKEGRRALTDETRQRWQERNRALAQQGLRVIALAQKRADSAGAEAYSDLTFLGLAAMIDPPREDVRDSLETCKQAGVRVVVVTGDQPETARAIAQAVGLLAEKEEGAAGEQVIHGGDAEIGRELAEEERQRLLDATIFARVSPAQKLDLLALHQSNGSVVGMTGDGVNDAPALKQADIGIAMGQRGTQVAKQAADMVLRDDAFATIVAAIEQGRAIFQNIRDFVLYLLSCNLAEIMTVGVASVIEAPLPIRPLQILFLNLVTDVFPALALGMGEGDPHDMKIPPRDKEEPVLTRRHWLAIGGYSTLLTLAVLAALALSLAVLDTGERRAVTISFLTLAFAQLWHVFNMREPGTSLFDNHVVRNPYVWGALLLCTALLLAAVYVPFLATLLRVVDPQPAGWGLILGLSLLPLIIGQIIKYRTGGTTHDTPSQR